MIHFEKVTFNHLEIIWGWLKQDHIVKFWDTTQAHKDDIINFVEGRKLPSNYVDGKYSYWLASFDHEAFAMLMTIQETHKEDIEQVKLDSLSKTGHTYGLDYMIGNPSFLGKGYGVRTLTEFMDFFRLSVDSKADTFLIDPDSHNERAKQVYLQAGFVQVGDFIMEGDYSGAGKLHHLLVKQFEPSLTLYEATLREYPLIQNMARFYVYDLSRECGHISSDWALPNDGLYESFDFKSYFEENTRKAYLVRVYDEIAGFVLLNQQTLDENNQWNMGEFFILAKFQHLGIGKQVAFKIWALYPGKWEVTVIPENKKAEAFWEKAISKYTKNRFDKVIKLVKPDRDQPRRIIFTFDTFS